MARCMFTSDERKRIDSIASELDQTFEEFFDDARGLLPAVEWDFLKNYARSCISRALEVGTMLRAVAESRPTVTIPYPGRGAETFVRDALAAWRDAFAPIPDVWRLAPIFEKIEGGESRVLADVAALEVMAANRMFISLDEQYQAFFATE